MGFGQVKLITGYIWTAIIHFKQKILWMILWIFNFWTTQWNPNRNRVTLSADTANNVYAEKDTKKWSLWDNHQLFFHVMWLTGLWHSWSFVNVKGKLNHALKMLVNGLCSFRKNTNESSCDILFNLFWCVVVETAVYLFIVCFTVPHSGLARFLLLFLSQ